MSEQYVIYEYLETSSDFDIYRGVDLKNRAKVVIKIFQKPVQEDEGEKNELSTDFFKKRLEEIAMEEKACRKSSGLFLPRCVDRLES